MKKLMFSALLIMLFGCADTVATAPDASQLRTRDASIPWPDASSVWVCHNPTSEYHGSVCNEECYWVGFQRVPSAFCWLLEESDCTGNLEYDWQRNNCYLLGR